MPPRLDDLPKGHSLPPSTFDLSPEWVEQYAAAVEDGAIASLGGELVPPMAVAALAVRALLERARLPHGAVHLGQEMTFRRSVRIGSRLSASATIASRGERQGWALMGIDLTVADGAGEVVMDGRATVTMPLGGGG